MILKEGEFAGTAVTVCCGLFLSCQASMPVTGGREIAEGGKGDREGNHVSIVNYRSQNMPKNMTLNSSFSIFVFLYV